MGRLVLGLLGGNLPTADCLVSCAWIEDEGWGRFFWSAGNKDGWDRLDRVN